MTLLTRHNVMFNFWDFLWCLEKPGFTWPLWLPNTSLCHFPTYSPPVHAAHFCLPAPSSHRVLACGLPAPWKGLLWAFSHHSLGLAAPSLERPSLTTFSNAGYLCCPLWQRLFGTSLYFSIACLPPDLPEAIRLLTPPGQIRVTSPYRHLVSSGAKKMGPKGALSQYVMKEWISK